MSCLAFSGRGFRGFICGIPSTHRLRLSDGSYVFMEWHSYGGPMFFRDRRCTREILEWWEDERLVEAQQWFSNRGRKA